LESREEFIKPYQYLYTKRDPEGEQDDKERRLISDEEAFGEEFGWYVMLYTAAGEQYLKIDDVVKSKASEFLTFMNFYKRKTELDNRRINKYKQ
jgi:hypothetical protein